MTEVVTCLMPTYNRRPWVELSIRCWLQQDWPDRELIVLDDGTDQVDDLCRVDPRIRHVDMTGTRWTIGAKWNLGVSLAWGRVIACWADDDWHAPWRLRYQVTNLLASKAGICGTDRMWYWDLDSDVMWHYSYIPNKITQVYLCGGTMMFRYEFWRQSPFQEINTGEDNQFIAGRHEGILSLADESFYVATIHPGNTSRKPESTRRSSEQWTTPAGMAPPVLQVPDWWWKAVPR
jgi:glycosyltransferase involved in cell wall biosynthesis